MRRLLVAAALVLGGLVTVSAQSYSVIAEWDPNAPTDNVTQYRVTIDSTVYFVDAASCTTVCSQPIAVTTGQHTLSVAAANTYGWGPSASLTFSLSVPGKSNNLRIRIP